MAAAPMLSLSCLIFRTATACLGGAEAAGGVCVSSTAEAAVSWEHGERVERRRRSACCRCARCLTDGAACMCRVCGSRGHRGRGTHAGARHVCPRRHPVHLHRWQPPDDAEAGQHAHVLPLGSLGVPQHVGAARPHHCTHACPVASVNPPPACTPAAGPGPVERVCCHRGGELPQLSASGLFGAQVMTPAETQCADCACRRRSSDVTARSHML